MTPSALGISLPHPARFGLEARETLTHRRNMVPHLFHGETLHLMPCGAIWWPAAEALLVADLHFGKARFFAATGQFLPPYDSVETALQLADRVARTGARRVICLGDSFHDADGAAHLAADACEVLLGIAARVEWIWITGNHDDAAHFAFGRAVEEMNLRDVVLRHEARADCTAPEISGHFHPKIRLRHRGTAVSRRCFLVAGKRMIMPAFGALTGGLDVRHPAIRKAMGEPITALVPGAERVLHFPVTTRMAVCA